MCGGYGWLHRVWPLGSLLANSGWSVLCVYGVLWLVSPSLENVSAISFLVLPECALPLWMWIMCGVQYICCTISAISNMYGWWCCDVGW